MFRSLMGIIRELYLHLTEVIFMLQYSVKLRRYINYVMWQHVVERHMSLCICWRVNYVDFKMHGATKKKFDIFFTNFNRVGENKTVQGGLVSTKNYEVLKCRVARCNGSHTVLRCLNEFVRTLHLCI